MGGGGRVKLVAWPVKFAWIRACVKAGLPDDLDHPGQQKCEPKEEWLIMVIAC